MLLEPETRYRVIKTEENKEGLPGVTWITIKATDSSPIIEKVIERVTEAKEGKQKMILIFLSFYFHREDEVCRVACNSNKAEQPIL